MQSRDFLYIDTQVSKSADTCSVLNLTSPEKLFQVQNATLSIFLWAAAGASAAPGGTGEMWSTLFFFCFFFFVRPRW